MGGSPVHETALRAEYTQDMPVAGEAISVRASAARSKVILEVSWSGICLDGVSPGAAK
jgi:hypothetical protein